MPRSAGPIDLVVGERLRLRRKELDLGPTALGALIGLGYQNIQKYEDGRSRISAGRLYVLSQALAVPIFYFFDRHGEAPDQADDLSHSASLHSGIHGDPLQIARVMDAIVAERVRFRRSEIGLKLSIIAEKLGTSLQQVHKYETGKDRISAGRLYLLGSVLSVPIEYFFIT